MVTECINYIAVEKYNDSGRHVGLVYEGVLSSFDIEKG